MLDLFSGIGGFSLAASWVWGDELDIVGFCEIDEFCHKVLNKNFPGVPIYKDITKLDTKNFKDIDLITGGFPCQDISIAGKGKGLIDEETGERTRSGLWSEMHRIISDIRPRFAVIENVPMLTIRGGTRVLEDLAKIGYDAEWQIVGADQVGAWHKRKRIWIVAYSQEISDSDSIRHLDRQTKEQSTERRFDALGQSESSSTHEKNVSDSDRRKSNSRNNNKPIKETQFELESNNTDARNVSDSDNNGFIKSRCKKVCCENAHWKNKKKKWATCTKDLIAQGSNGTNKRKSKINKTLFIRGDEQKDKTTKSKGVCKLPKKSDYTENIIRKNKNKTDNCRTLVSQRQGGVQLSIGKTLGKNQATLKKNKVQQRDDLFRVNRVGNKKSENVPDSENIRCECCLYETEQGWSSLRFGPRKFERCCENVPDSDSIRGCSWETNWEDAENARESSRGKKSGNRNIESQMGNLANGLPSRMAGCWDREPDIPRVANNQKDRVNKLKALGNSIVPEVAYQILKRIAH